MARCRRSGQATRRRPAIAAALGMAFLCGGGCGPPPPPRIPVYMPMDEAVRTLNDNNGRLTGRLFGSGVWSGRLTLRDGRRESPDGSFDLHFVAPDKLCFVARGLGGNYFEAGCNPDECWFWMQYERDELVIGSQEAMAGAVVEGIPLEPDRLLDALGARPLPDAIGPDAPLYRVDGDHHQIIYETILEDGRAVIEREYWLSRYEPFLLERVLHRSPDGRILVDARLSDYRALPDGGPLVARKVEIDCPQHDSRLTLEFRRQKLYGDVNPVWFTQPAARHDRDPRHRTIDPAHIRRLDDVSDRGP